MRFLRPFSSRHRQFEDPATISGGDGRLFAGGGHVAVLLSAEEKLQFNRDIRSILSDNCFLCHGPDKNRRQADLRLDIRDQAMDHQAIVPGKPDESEVVARIYSTDADMIMPPPESNKKLSDEQKALIKRWIAEGGEYQGHWAYEPPVKPATPEGVNAIDHLVGERLAQAGLQISPEADRRTLARRLYFDLTGPPAQAGGSRSLHRRRVAPSLRAAGGQVAGLAAVRRTDGDPLAGCGPLCRHDRIPLGQPAERVAVSRLGHQGVQREQAVRPVHDRTTGRRPAAGQHAGAEGRFVLQPLAAVDRGRRGAAEGLRSSHADGSRASCRDGVARPDAGLLPVPRSQVRSRHDAGLLFAGRLFRRHPGTDHRPPRRRPGGAQRRAAEGIGASASGGRRGAEAIGFASAARRGRSGSVGEGRRCGPGRRSLECLEAGEGRVGKGRETGGGRRGRHLDGPQSRRRDRYVPA